MVLRTDPNKMVLNRTIMKHDDLIISLFLLSTFNTNPKAIAPLIVPEIQIMHIS